MRTLIIGDRFIPATSYRQAFADRDPEGDIALRSRDWLGSKADHHQLQQQMETEGANAVPAPPELAAAIGTAEAVCLHFAPLGSELLSQAPDLKLIAVARAGLENVDVTTATQRGIAVVGAAGRNAGAVAELQIALMLAETRNVARADASIKAGDWRKDFTGGRLELADSVIGMVGFGHVGREFARRLSGFAPQLIAFDPYADDQLLSAHGVGRVHQLADVFRASDFVVVQARHSTETHRFIGSDELKLMKPNAYFINVSRSRVVDSDALLDALIDERIAGAGLDVFDDEPLPMDSRWRSLDNVTMTTHFGGDTESTNARSAAIVADAVLEFARTGRVLRAHNAAALGWT